MAFILCLCIVVTMFIPVAPVKALEDSAYIEFNEEIADYIYISDVDKKVVSAVFEGEALSYQWQILADSENGIWANIYDKTAPECEVSYALVKNILELSGTASIRCKITHAEGEVFTNVLSVLIREEENISAPETEEEMILVSEMEIVEPEEELIEEEFSEEEPTEEETGEEIPEEEPAEEELYEESSEEEEPEEPTEEAGTFSFERISEESEKLLADGDGEKDLVTITIKHLDHKSYKDNGEEKEILGPYIATIQRGTNFHQQIITPTFLGYAPFYNGDEIDQENDGDLYDDDATVLELDYQDIQEDIVIKVFYKASLVDYAIKYFFQNTNDDLYTEDPSRYFTDKAETGTIITDDEIKSHAGDTNGFSKIYHIPEAVAADGSTVFECYYDRNYYLIKFDLDGGYGVDPLYARYGTQFVINNPVKPGYVFGGWDLNVDGNYDGVKDDLPNKVPAFDLNYKAIWTEANTTYTVVYWKENADDNGYSYWGYDVLDARSGNYVNGADTVSDEVAGDEKEYFEFNNVLSDKNVLVEGDGSTVVNVYYTRNYYKITFKDVDYNNCTIPTTHKHTDACYAYKCVGNHTHTDACIVCRTESHSHVDSCYTCGKEKHSHSEECCTSTQHTHTVNCWDNVGDKYNGTPSNAPRDPQNGQIYSYNWYGRRYRYIYLFDSWYEYEGTENSGTIAAKKCTGHVHGVDNCNVGCGKEEHSHSDSCGTSCGKTAHIHNDSCYNCNTGTHEHDASCERIVCGYEETHTHDGNCIDTIKIVYAKYQQNIDDIWPIVDDNGKTYNSGERWKPSDSSYFSQVLVYIANMPADNFVLTLDKSSNSTKTMNYYLQALPGEEYDKTYTYDGKNYFLYKTIKAKYNYITKAEDFFDIYGFEQYESDPAFSGNQITASTANFYYDRVVDHYLEFSNNGVKMDDKRVFGIMYGASIEKYNFIPEYPSNLEPNAYYFDGWYTSPGCFDGTEVDWDTITMPEGDLLLYAKWSPTVHTVRFFNSYDDLKAYEENGSTEGLVQIIDNIPHGIVVPEEVKEATRNDENGNALTFGGWFFMENGVKRRFTPLEYPIKRDMNIFADWSTHSPQPYRISYVLKEDPTVKVADDSVGYAYAGSTRTFTAKAGAPSNQLYDFSASGGINYNKGYFPTTASHSITIAHEEDDKNAVQNVHTFEYVKALNIQYTVQYINKETNTIMEEEKKYTDNAVVTERFKVFADMIPDAFYKRLVISVEQDENGNWVGTEENIIKFYYTPDKKNAYYAVRFMKEKLGATPEQLQNFAIDGSGGYELTETHIEGIGEVGKTVSIDPTEFEFDGFSIIPDKAKEIQGSKETTKNLVYGKYNIEITVEGTELYIFYSRNEYEYNVYYYIYNTEDHVPYKDGYYPNENGNAKYGSNLTRTAPVIDGYTCVSQNKTQTLLIRDNVKQNVLVFYYSPTQYTVEYVAVPPEGGWLSSTLEVIKGTEDFTGSVPTANEGYRFDGWFKNEDCTVPVANTDVGTIEPETNKLTPNKKYLSETERNIFYAKFTLLAADFTIERQNAADNDQVFVYEVKNNGTGAVITVTITGNGSVTIKNLPLGKYTVTQKNGWSWRYSETIEIEHSKPEGTKVIFVEKEENIYWLNGSSEKIVNKRKGGGD